MEKKLIIGISSYAGSNTTAILELVAYMLLFKSKILKIYTLKEHSVEQIARKIRRCKNPNAIYIIKHVREVAVLEQLKAEFAEENFNPIGIEVQWEDCFKNFKRKGQLDAAMQEMEWRKLDKVNPLRKAIRDCFDKIGARDEAVFFCQEGNEFEQAGRITGAILRM